MDFNRLTIKSGEAVAAAQELARRRGNPEVYPEHLCIALLDQELPRTLVERAGESVDSLRAECEAKLAQKPAVQGSSQQPHASAEFGRVLDKAEEEMRELEDELGKARARLERLERELRHEIRNVHKQYKREVVLYRREGDGLPERTRWTSTG